MAATIRPTTCAALFLIGDEHGAEGCQRLPRHSGDHRPFLTERDMVRAEKAAIVAAANAKAAKAAPTAPKAMLRAKAASKAVVTRKVTRKAKPASKPVYTIAEALKDPTSAASKVSRFASAVTSQPIAAAATKSPKSPVGRGSIAGRDKAAARRAAKQELGALVEAGVLTPEQALHIAAGL